MDVADGGSVERSVAEAGQLDLLVANAGISEGLESPPSWTIAPVEWWRVYEVNVLGVHLCCRAAIPGMLKRGGARIVITGSGAAYLPGGHSTAYALSKAAVCRYAEMLANELAGRIPVFFFSPGLVKTDLNAGALPDDAPWTPPELAPELVRKLATGRHDAPAGRYLHAEHDDLDELLERIDAVRERDLNAIRLRREPETASRSCLWQPTRPAPIPVGERYLAEGIARAVMTRRTDAVASIAVFGAGARVTAS